MGLWDDSTEESGIVENQYIIDPSSGLNLICEILPKNMQKKTLAQMKNLCTFVLSVRKDKEAT